MDKELKEFVVTEKDFDPEKNIGACVYGPPIRYFFTCPECGHEWTSFMRVKKICPKCGTVCSDYTTD